MALFLALASSAAWATPRAAEGESRFVGLDDSLVHYRSWGKGSPVILIHGFAQDIETWRAQISALAKSHRVIALDLPGHGDSGGPHDGVYDFTRYARAVEAVAKDAGVAHAALVGHSMGFPIATTVLRRGVLTVDKIVSVDGAVFNPASDADRNKAVEHFAAVAAGVRSPSAPTVMEQFFSGLLSKAPDKLRAQVLAHARTADSYVAASTLDHFLTDPVWQTRRSPIPVLALCAEESVARTHDLKGWLAANYPKARMVALKDVDHFLHQEQPQRVNEALLGFLKQ